MIESLSVKLKYESPLHAKLKNLVLGHYNMSLRKMQMRYDKWRKAEDLYQAYVKPSTDDTRRKSERESKGNQHYVTLTVPYSYATLLTAHTYWCSVFLGGRVPVLQFTGRHGESQQKVQAIEALIDYQLTVGQMLPALYLWLLDAGKYGIGILGNYWADETIQVSRIVERPRTFLGIEIPGKIERVREVEKLKGYEGNKIYNIRPYDFFPDPRVTLANLQDGEFCGRRTSVNWNTILRGEAQGRYMNVEDLKKRLETSDREQGSSNIDLPDDTAQLEAWNTATQSPSNVQLIEMVEDLVPEEYDLGTGKEPEKWVITLGQKDVVICARPLGSYHNRFPYFLQTYEVASYEHVGRGMLEIIEPLNKTLDWLFNSHFFNVRKVLNDQLIVDPSRVEMRDLTDGGPGKLIRLKSGAYGTDVRTVISQLPVMDVTSLHMKDAQTVIEVIQRITGVADNLMGMVYPGGRKTATEVRTSSSFGVNRLRTFAEYNSALGWSPLAQVLVQNTQQLYSDELQFKIAGDLLQGNPQFLKVTPEDIQGFFDFVPVDGTLPIDRFAQAQLWKEILSGLPQMPQVAMQYDVAGIFSWMAQLAGLKNISQFKIQVVPNASVMAGMQKGNLVPIDAGRGSSGAAIPGPAGSAITP